MDWWEGREEGCIGGREEKRIELERGWIGGREEKVELVGGKRRGLNWWEEKRIELVGREED